MPGFLERNKKKALLAPLLAFFQQNKSASIILIVAAPLTVSLFLRSSGGDKSASMIGDKTEAPQDVRAYRRSMSARMVMSYDDEEDDIEEIVRGQQAIQGKALTFDGVARNMPQSVRGVLRPRDAPKGGGLAISEEALAKGLRSASYAMVVSDEKKRSMSPAGAAMDMGAPVAGGKGVAAGQSVAGGRGVAGGEGVAAGQGVAAGGGVGGGQGVAIGKGVAAGPGPGPEQLVTGGADLHKALSPESRIQENIIRDRKSISSIKGLQKGGRIQQLLSARTEQDLNALGGAELVGEDAVYQLSMAHAFSVAASDQPEGCSSGACPAGTAKDAAGIVYDGNKLPATQLGGGGVAGIGGGGDIDTLRKKSKEYEEAVDDCAEAEKDQGKKVRDAMLETKRHNQSIVYPKARICHELLINSIKKEHDYHNCMNGCEEDCAEKCDPHMERSKEYLNQWQVCTGECNSLVEIAFGKCSETNTQATAMAEICPLYKNASMADCANWKTEMSAYCNQQ
ncbi:MAG: hypothetical protein ABIJ96_18650 [Elusimicrobiota bacterium]